MIARLFKSKRPPARARPSVPEGRRVYAIGDIHGRHDLLIDLLGQIEDDDRSRGAAQTTIVFLGDLVDRGPDSRSVIETAKVLAESDIDVRFIAGNHEEVFVLAASGDAKATKFFTKIGGRETILSYSIAREEYGLLDHKQLAARLLTLIPRDHVDFIAGFAGSATRSSTTSAITARLSSTATRSEDVEIFDNRIGIDTGAYCNGRLTAIGLEGADRWFLSAVGEEHREWRSEGTRG